MRTRDGLKLRTSLLTASDYCGALSGNGRNERKGVGGRKEENPVEEIFLMARLRLMIYRVLDTLDLLQYGFIGFGRKDRCELCDLSWSVSSFRDHLLLYSPPWGSNWADTRVS